MNKNWEQVNTIWKYCHVKKWKHKSLFPMYLIIHGFTWLYVEMTLGTSLLFSLTTDKWTRCYLQPVRTLIVPLFISNCKFFCLQLTMCHLIADFFPITILWSSTSGLQRNFLLCRLIIEHITEHPTSWLSGTCSQNFHLFIYLLNFFSPTCGLWVATLKILFVDFTIGHKTPGSSIPDKIT